MVGMEHGGRLPQVIRAGRGAAHAVDAPLASAAIAVLATFLWHAPALWRGYFRADDFAFLHANGGLPLRDLLLLPHNEHILPFFRIEVAALDALFGINPLGWIVFSLLIFALVLFLVQRLLLAWGAGAIARLTAVVLIGGWSQWGEVLAGYFTLVIWIQLMALACAALLLQIRITGGRPRANDVLALAGVVVLALGFGEAALWVPMALLIVSLVDAGAEVRRGSAPGVALRSQRWPLAVANGAVISGAAFYLWALSHTNTNVLHTAAAAVSLGTRAALALKFLAAVVLAPWRVLDSAPLPEALAVALRTVVLIGTIGALLWSLRGSPAPRWRAAIACVLIICLHALLVTGGRPFEPAEWPAKHIGVPFIFFAMLVSLAVQSAVDRRASRPLDVRVFAYAGALFLILQVASETYAMRRGWPSGRREEWVIAGRRRAAIALLRDSLIAPIVAAGVREIPDLPPEIVERASTHLEFYDLAVYDRFVLPPSSGARFVRTADDSVFIPPGATIVADPFAATGPKFDSLIRSNTVVRRFYGMQR